jgi:hypothetical protein
VAIKCQVYTQVMPTTPTDDPLANSGRTVGIHAYQKLVTKSLKREALLFDQIGFRDLDYMLSDLDIFGFHEFHPSAVELYWLRDIGIARDVPPLHYNRCSSPVDRQFLDAIVAETGKPIDVTAIPDEGLHGELMRRLYEIEKTWDVHNAVLSRAISIHLRRDGTNAFPILETRSQIGTVFPSGTTPVLEVVLKSMPIPDDQTPWEDIIEFRNDPESIETTSEVARLGSKIRQGYDRNLIG